MGLDVVEIVMRCEAAFDVHLESARLEQMRTVSDLFELICEQLKLPKGPPPPSFTNAPRFPLRGVPPGGWTREQVWVTVLFICADQLQIRSDEIWYAASFVDDLGAS
jgi:hypothetical protein